MVVENVLMEPALLKVKGATAVTNDYDWWRQHPRGFWYEC
jgi:hypothetical protein